LVPFQYCPLEQVGGGVTHVSFEQIWLPAQHPLPQSGPLAQTQVRPFQIFSLGQVGGGVAHDPFEHT
jgi:hypothetical protein